MSFDLTDISWDWWHEILFNGFHSDLTQEDRSRVELKVAHFNPVNTWVEDGLFIKDATKEKYLNQNLQVLSQKCKWAFIGALAGQPLGLTLNLINRIVKIVSFAHLWHETPNETSLGERIIEWLQDILRVLLTPLVWIGLILSALYGWLFSPRDGAKLYATLERSIYSGGYRIPENPQVCMIAPCFQPQPRYHFFGGDPNDPDAW